MTTPTGPRESAVILSAETSKYIAEMKKAAAQTETSATAIVTAVHGIRDAWVEAEAAAKSAARSMGAIPVIKIPTAGAAGGSSAEAAEARAASAARRSQEIADDRAAASQRRLDNAWQAGLRRHRAAEQQSTTAQLKALSTVDNARRAGLKGAERVSQAELALDNATSTKRVLRAKAAEARLEQIRTGNVMGLRAAAHQDLLEGGGTTRATRADSRNAQIQAEKDYQAAQTRSTAASKAFNDAAVTEQQQRIRLTAAEKASAQEAVAAEAALEAAAAKAARAEARGTSANAAAAAQRAAMNRQITSLNDVSRVSSRFGGGLAIGFGLAAAAAIKWQNQMIEVNRITGATGDTAKSLEVQLRSLSTSTPASHGQVADIAIQAAQLGISTPNIYAFTKSIIELGTVTDISASTAASQLAKLIAVTGDTVPKVQAIGSALVALSNAGASTVPEIINIAQRFAGAAAAVHLPTDQLLAFASTLAGTGNQAEAYGSALQSVFLKINLAIGTGNKSLGGFAKTLGVSNDEFAARFSKDPGGTFTAIIGKLHDIEKAGGNVSVVLDQMGIKNIRQVQSMDKLTGAYDKLVTNLKAAHDAYAANTALEAAFQLQQDSALNKLKEAENRIVDAAISIGDAFLPVIAGAAEKVGALAKGFQDLNPWVQKAIELFLGAGGSLLLVVAIASKVASGILKMQRAWQLYATSQLLAQQEARATSAAMISQAEAAGATEATAAAAARGSLGAATAAEATAVAAAEAAASTEASAVAANAAAAAATRAGLAARGGALAPLAGAGATRAATNAAGVSGLAGMAATFGKVSLYGTAAVATVVGLHEGIKALDNSANKHANIDNYTASLKLLADQGVATDTVLKNFGPKGDDFSKLFAPTGGAREGARSFFNKLGIGPLGPVDRFLGINVGNLGDDLVSKLGFKNGSRDAKQFRQDTDKALAALVNNNNADEAAKVWAGIAAAGAAAGHSTEELTQIFPQYTAAANGPLGVTQKLAKAQEDVATKAQAIQQNLANLKAGFTTAADADDKYNLSLLDMADKAKEAKVSIEDLRAAVDDSVSKQQSAGKAADDYQSSLNSLRKAIKGTADESKTAADAVDVFKTAIDKALSSAFDPQDALDKFKGKIDDIKTRIAGNAGNGISTDMSMVGDTSTARENRADAQDLTRNAAELYRQDVALGNNAKAAFATRRKDLEAALTEVGYYKADIAKALAQFDSLPKSLAEAAKQSAAAGGKSGGTAPRSTTTTGKSDDAIANRNAIRELVAQTAAQIEQDKRFGGSTKATTQAINDHRAALVKDLRALGFSQKQIAPYIDDLNGMAAAYGKAAAGAEKWTPTTDPFTRTGIGNRQAMRELATEAADRINAFADPTTGHTPEQIRKYAATIEADFKAHLGKLGFTAKQFATSLDFIRDATTALAGVDVPKVAAKDTTLKVKADTSPARKSVQQLEQDLANTPVKVPFQGQTGSKAGKVVGWLQWAYDGIWDLQKWLWVTPITLTFKAAGAIGGAVKSIGGSVVGGVKKVVGGVAGALGFADGGIVKGPGGGRDDKIPAMLSNGEAIIPAAKVAAHRGLVDHLLGSKNPYTSRMPTAPFDQSQFGRATAPSAAPVINLSGGGEFDYERLAALVGSRPVVINLDGRQVARVLGDDSHRRVRGTSYGR